MTAEHRDYFESLLGRMEPFGHVTGKAMFGGFGFWEDGDMFALIDSSGTFRLKVDDTTVDAFEQAGSDAFSPEMTSGRPPVTMPYWSVPAKVLRNETTFEAWVSDAIAVGHATAKRKGRSTKANVTKKAPAKKAPAKKVVAKKPPAKKVVAKKVVAKRAPVKGTAAKMAPGSRSTGSG